MMKTYFLPLNLGSHYKAFKAIVLIWVLMIAGAGLAWGQPQLITPGSPGDNYTPYPVTFTDEAQRVIVIELTEEVTITGADSTGWSVTVGGIPVAITGSSHSGNFIRFQLASSISFAQRSTVRISYNGTGNIVGNVSGLQLGAIANYTAVNNLKWGCAGLTGVKSIGTVSLKICAPTKARYSIEYSVKSNTRNSIYFNQIMININYGDPLNNLTQGFFMLEMGSVGSGNFRFESSEFTYQIQDVCSFRPYVWPVFVNSNGYANFNCLSTSARQDYAIPSAQLDNLYTGELLVFPEIGSPLNEYCVGEDIPGHIFYDNTQFNCRFEVEPERPNIAQRTVQFIYGTNLNGNPRIPNVFIDVAGTMVQITDGGGNLIPFPTPSGFYEGPVFNYDNIPLPGAEGTTYPTHEAYPIYHAGDFNDIAGMRFEVTMRQWGPCNPYNEFDISNRIEQTSYVELIPSPPPPSVTDVPACEGAVPATLTATPLNPVHIVRWYDTAEKTNTIHTGNTYTHGKSAPGIYTYYVNSTGGNGCEGPIDSITLTINPLPAITSQPSNTTVCELSNAVFNATATVPLPSTIASYQWQRRITTGVWSDISAGTDGGIYTGFNTSTLSISNTPYFSNYTYRVRVTSSEGCQVISNIASLTVNRLAIINTQPVPRAVCDGENTTFSVVTAATPNVTARLWQVSTDNGVSWANLANGGIYSGVTTATLTLTNVTTAYSGYQYRCVLTTTGPCTRNTNAVLLTVHPLPINRTVNADDAWLCYNTGTNINLLSSENSTVYQLRIGATNVGSTQTGNGNNLAFPTGLLTSNTTFNVNAALASTIGLSTRTCYRQMSATPLINVNPQLALPALTHPNVCIDGLIDLPEANPSGGSGTFTYAWSGTGGYTSTAKNPPAYTPLSTGPFAFSVIVTDEGFRTASSDNTVCSISGNLNFVVNPIPDTRVVSPVLSLVCYNTSTSITIPASQAGVRYDLYRSTGDVFVASVNGSGGDVSVSTGNLTANTNFYVVAVNTTTSCDRTLNTVTVNVNPRFELAQLHDNASICNNTSTNFNISLTGGVSSYTVNYTRNGVPLTTGPGYASGSNISTGILTTGNYVYSITSATDLNGCPVENTGTDITIIVGSNPTQATMDLSDDVCVGANSDFRSVITGGAPPYRINYTLNGVAQPLITSYTSGSIHNLGPLAVGSYIVEITSVRDTCNQLVPVGGLPSSDVINVNPIPTAVSTVNNTAQICYDGFTDIVLGSDVPGSDFNWLVTYTPAVVWETGRAPANGTRVNGIGTSISQQLAHTGSAPVTVTYTITPRGPAPTNCPGSSITRNVVVNPRPTLTSSLTPPAICSGTAFSYNPTSATTGTTFSWTRGAIAGITPAGSTSGTGNPNEVLNNTGNSPISVTYAYTLSANGCTNSNTYNVVVIVNPSAQVNEPSDQVICTALSTSAVNFTTSRSGGSTTYAWTNNTPSIGLAAGGTGNVPSFVAANSTTAPVTATITVTPTFTNAGQSCSGPAETFTIIVNPAAQVNDIANRVVCNNGTSASINLSSNLTGGTPAFSWVNNTPAIGLAANGIGNVPEFTAVNAGTSPITATITVTPTFTNGGQTCAGPVKTFTITVNPSAQVNDPANQVVCNGSPVAAINFSTNRSGGATTYTWTNSNTSIGLAASGSTNISSFNAINTGTEPVTATITITPTFTNGGQSCSGLPESFTITVNPTAQVNDISNQVICSGVNTAAINFSTNRTGGITTYTWTNNIPSIGLAASGSGSITAFTGTNFTPNPVIATITVTPSFANGTVNCTGPAKNFTITVNPVPVINPASQSICSGTNPSLIVSANVPGTTFSWEVTSITGSVTGTSVGNTGIGATLTEVLSNTGSANGIVTYQFTPTAPAAVGGCSGSPVDINVTVRPEPVLTPGQNPSACSGNPLDYLITLNNFTNPADGVSFSWNAPVLNPVNPGFTGGTARSTFSSANITDLFINTTGVIGTATYTITPRRDGCNGAPVVLVVSVGSEPVLDPNLNKAVCSNTDIELTLIQATGSVVPTYYNILSKTVDAGLSVITEASVPGSGNALYLFNDRYANTTGVNRTVTYRVQPVLAPDCFGDPVNVVITIRPEPVILPGQAKTVCSGVAIGREILLVPANTPAGSFLNWNAPVMSDASVQGTAGINVSADPAGTIHINDEIYNYSGSPITATYTITPVSSFTCQGQSRDVVITINPQPVDKPVSGRDKLCAGDKNEVFSVDATPGSIFTWTVPAEVGVKAFDFNTNTILIDAALVSGSGDITVFERNSFGCAGDVSMLTVEVYLPPVPENISGNNKVCANSTQVYSVTERPGSVYNWTVPAGAAIIGNPSAHSITIVFSNVGGTILVRETNAAGCVTDHIPFAVTVDPLPTATISNGGSICQEGSQPLNVAFTGTGPYNFIYAINGAPQPAVNGVNSPYTLNVNTPGTYTIVSVTDANGCNNVGTGNAIVTHFPVPLAVISGSIERCLGSSATLTISLAGAAPYSFVYTDGVTPVSINNHPSNIYTVNVSPALTTSYSLVSMVDNNGCNGLVSGNAVITIHNPPVLDITGTNLLCNNDNTGEVNMTITGSSPFGIVWTGPDGYNAGTEDISGLSAGIYNVSVTDANSCSSTAAVTIAQPPILSLSNSGNVNLLCNGDNTAAGSFTAAGGTAPYAFTVIDNTAGASIDPPGASNISFTGGSVGTVRIRVTDSNNCMAEATITISQPPALSLTSTLTQSIEGSHNINCYGGNNGGIGLSVTGGVAPYTYTWTTLDGSGLIPGSSNQSALTAGTYEVTVRDANNCTLVQPFTLTQPDELVVTATTDDDIIGTCSNANLGVVVNGGVPIAADYLYSWTPAAGLSATNISNPVASPASTTTYTVTVTDANNCSRTASVTINVAPLLMAVASTSDNQIGDCPGSFASLNVNASGGEELDGGGYLYSWLPVTGLDDPSSSSPQASPPVSTTYTVTVTDKNGCIATANITVNVVAPLTAVATTTDLLIGTCPSSTALLDVTVSGGEAPYTYLWDNAGSLQSPSSQRNPVAKPVISTLYTVTVTDNNGCTTATSVLVEVADELTAAAIADDEFIGTCPASIANLDVIVTGGEEAYTYRWVPSAGLDDPFSKTPVAKPLTTTLYTVTVTDANGCTAVSSIAITVQPVLNVAVNSDDYIISTCPTSVGNLNSMVTGGEPGYQYSWLPVEGLVGGTDIPNPIAKPDVTTTYTLIVTDNNGCTSTASLTIVVRPELAATATASDLLIGTCPTSNSTLNVNVTGGEAGYSYSWAPALGLSADNIPNPVATPDVTTTYTVTVTDVNGCSTTADVTITVAPDLTVTAVTDDALIGTCPSSVANLDAIVTGGEPGYSFSWTPSTGLSNPTLKSPVAKPSVTTTYTVTVTDANGCVQSSPVTIVVADPLTATISTDDNMIGTCPTSVANLSVTVNGGEPGYTYNWLPLAGLDDPTSPNPEAKPDVTTTYTVTVTDANGCITNANITIVVLPALTAAITASDYNIGTCLGSVSNLDVIVNGGEAAYSYSWLPVAGLSNPGLKNPVAKPDVTTTYIVTVTDINGCTTTAEVTINVLDPLAAVASVDDGLIGTCPTSIANLDVSVTGGEPGYTYSWMPVTGLSDPNVRNPVAKPAATTTYVVTVQDLNGCITTSSVQVTVADPLGVVIAADDEILGTCPTSMANLTASVTGGEPGYTYLWSPVAGLTDPTIPNPIAKPDFTTTYTTTVTDANGCIATSSKVINVRPPLVATASASDYSIGTCATSTSQLNVNVSGGEEAYSYSWAPSAGLSNTGIPNPVAQPLVTTTYIVTVTDANNCQTTASVTIVVAPELSVTASVDDNLIGTCPSSVATLLAVASGGETPYTYLWDNAVDLDDATKPNPVAKPASTTVYTVTVTDANGCQAVATVTVNVADELLANAFANDNILSTCPSSVANLDVNVTGGEELAGGGYTYSWSPAAGLNYINVKNPVAKPAATTTYTVTVTDRNGCTAQSQVTIEVRPPLALTYTTIKYNGNWDVSCNGALDGGIDLTVSGGEGPFIYSWTGPSVFTSSDEDISLLGAGTYNITVRDANGCQVSTSVVLAEPAPVNLSKTPDVNLACYSDSTATGSFNVNGGTSPYSFNVLSNTSSADITIGATSASFINGGAGLVRVQVVDANGCSTEQSILISQPDELLPGSVIGNQEVCYLGNPSVLSEVDSPSGGSSAYTYQWEFASDMGGPYTNVFGATSPDYDPPAGIADTTYYRRRVSSGTCNPVYSNVLTVIVNPLPVASISGGDFICPASNAILTVDVTTGLGPFVIELSDGTIVNNYNSGDPIIINPVINTLYTIASVSDSEGCIVNAPHPNLTGSVLITIKVLPEIMIQPANVTVCEGDTAQFLVDAGMTTNPLYQWYVDRNDGLGLQILPGEESSILRVAAIPSMNGFKYIAEVLGDCAPSINSNEAILTVNNLPQVLTHPLSVTVCAGEDAMFIVNGGVTSGVNYSWYVSTAPGVWNLAIGTRYQGTFSDTLIVVSTLEGMSGYRFKARITGICSPFVESNEVSLTVTRQAEIMTQPVNVSLCENETANFFVDAGLTTGPSYQWQIEDSPGVWSDLSLETNASLVLPNINSSMNGNNYRVIVSSTCGSSLESGSASLTVYEKPEILEHPNDTTVCAGANIRFSVNPGVTTGASFQWEMSADGGTTWVNTPSGGNYLGSTAAILNVYSVDSAMNGYRYRAVISGFCSPSDTSLQAILSVNTSPKITAQPIDRTICEGSTTTYNISAVGTDLDYQWQVDMRDGMGFRSFSDTLGIYSGVTSTQLNVTGIRRLNNFRYRAIITGTCGPQAITNFGLLNVNTSPEIIDPPVSDTICEFNSVNFNVIAQGAGLSFIWQESVAGGPFLDLMDTANYIGTSTSSMNIFNVNRTKNNNRYRVIIQGICAPPVSTIPIELIVRTSPLVTIPPSDTTICENGTATFRISAEGAGLTYQWQVRTGGSYSAIIDDATYSGSLTPELTLTGANPVMDGNRYRVRVSGLCPPAVDSPPATLYIVDNPVILFDPVDAEICANENTGFTASASGPDLIYRWQVNTGAGFTDLTDNVYYAGTGTNNLSIMKVPLSFNNYKYRLQVSNACLPVPTAEANLVVNPNPTANITGSGSFPLVCGGDELFLDGNPDDGSGNYLTHSWSGSVGPLSVMNTPQTMFKTLVHGSYDLVYSVTDDKGCKASDTVTIQNDRPDARFLSNAVPSCGSLMVDFTNQSVRAVSYEWDFNDGSPVINSESPSHGFDNFNPTGQVNYYNVKLTATSAYGCKDVDSSNVIIYPKINSTFDIEPEEGCQPFVATMITQPGALSYEWNFGDGHQVSAGYAVLHEFRNLDNVVKTYKVRLVTTSFYGCRDTAFRDVTVYPLPQPSFAVSPVLQTFPDATVSITNLVNEGPWNYLYTFGDGNSSASQEPVHTYTDPGTYTVRQIINIGQCTDSISQTVVINPAPPVAGFNMPPSGCTPHQVLFTNTSLYANSYIWSFGDGGVSTKKEPVYTYFYPGTYLVRLTVSGPGGSSSYQETIEIFETPTPGFSYAPDTVFEDYKPAKFFNFTVGVANYLWDFGDINEDNGDISSQNNSSEYEPTHVYEHPGWKDVSLIAYNDNCADTLLIERAILVLPRKEFLFPNVFRPNPGGPSGGYYDRNDPNSRNQVFFPGVADDVLEYYMFIYNRWGELVFESNEINKGWDGYINNRMAAQGVYVWLVKGKYLNGENFIFKGDVTLLH